VGDCDPLLGSRTIESETIESELRHMFSLMVPNKNYELCDMPHFMHNSDVT